MKESSSRLKVNWVKYFQRFVAEFLSLRNERIQLKTSLHPRKLTWNPKNGGSGQCFFLFPLGGIFRFHVRFRGCRCFSPIHWSPHFSEGLRWGWGGWTITAFWPWNDTLHPLQFINSGWNTFFPVWTILKKRERNHIAFPSNAMKFYLPSTARSIFPLKKNTTQPWSTVLGLEWCVFAHLLSVQNEIQGRWERITWLLKNGGWETTFLL